MVFGLLWEPNVKLFYRINDLDYLSLKSFLHQVLKKSNALCIVISSVQKFMNCQFVPYLVKTTLHSLVLKTTLNSLVLKTTLHSLVLKTTLHSLVLKTTLKSLVLQTTLIHWYSKQHWNHWYSKQHWIHWYSKQHWIHWYSKQHWIHWYSNFANVVFVSRICVFREIFTTLALLLFHIEPCYISLALNP